jgi:hypothetical protein
MLEKQIPIGVIGRILNSDHEAHMVRVDDDASNTGGFLINQWWTDSNGPNPDNAFDDWVENRLALEAYFSELHWEIRWSPA